jgi:tetratricopeptide (TPR) repeat protein
VRKFKLIDWGALAAAAVGSLGCMGGSTSPFASKSPAGTSQTFAQQTASPGGQSESTFGQTAAAGAAGVSEALWNNPLSRAVKGAFTSEAEAIAQVQTSGSSNDPLSLGNSSKPPSPALYTSMGLMAERAGNVEKAREFHEQAIAAAPADADALLAYGHFHDRQGRLDQATRLYLDAIHADPQHAAAHNDLGLCYARQGQLPQALELVRRASQLRPDRPIYRNNVAKVLVEMGRSQEAVNELASVLSPAEAQYNVGCFLAQAGRQEEAANHFAAAVQIDPSMESARAWLARLQPGAIATLPPGGARTSSLAATGAVPARGANTGTPYGYGGVATGAGGTAAGQHRLPLITNVRPASAETNAGSGLSSLPQVSSGPPQQYASYAESVPATQMSNGTLPSQPSVWPQTHSTPYFNAAEERYQDPQAAASPGLSAGGGNTSHFESETSGQAPFGASHDSPWGSVPSPYDASSLEDTPFGYPATTANGTSTAGQPSRFAEPATVVNQYATTPYAATPHAPNPWGQGQQRTAHQAPTNAMR